MREDEDSYEIRSKTKYYPAIAESSSVDANLDPHPDAFVYNLLSRNCHDFAFVVASGLIEQEDRSLVLGVLFGSGEHQARVFEVVGICCSTPQSGNQVL